MKTKKITLISAALLASCVYVPQVNKTAQRVSDDYLVYGSTEGIKAYLYGNHTVIEPVSKPLFLWVYDTNDNGIDYEKVGRYYRLNRESPSFTAWVDGSPVTFYRSKKKSQVELAQAPTPEIKINQTTTPTPKIYQSHKSAFESANTTENEKFSQLITLTKNQNEEVKKELDGHLNANDTAWYQMRLNFIESRLRTESTATIRLPFSNKFSTKIQADEVINDAILSTVREAYLVNIRGRTDSVRSNKFHRTIALKRALNTRKYLIANGVPPDIINVFAKSRGDFIAPNNTTSGNALNRRVEIEIVHPNIAIAAGVQENIIQ